MLHKISLVIIWVLLSASVAYAQSIAPDPVQYTVIPEQPGPGEQVTIEVDGVGQFLGNSTITWQQDGKIIEAAGNSPTFRFTTGGVGSVTRIHLKIDSPTQGLITHDFVFNPSVVNMIWEADTYTPTLYKGKSLYTAGSPLKVVAYPTVYINGSVVPTSKLSFQWRHNDTPDPSSSGLGKNIFLFVGDQLQPEEDVSVTIYLGATIVAKGDMAIPASSPEVIFYPQDPLRGELLGSGFQGTAQLTQTETTFKAEPYFFSASAVRNSKLQYNWTLNDQETTGPDASRGVLTLRQTGSGAGAADLGVSIQNTLSSQFIQAANAGLHLIFGQSGSAFSSFFGL
ncbi:MAG TPA: hypothetical protein VG984_03500 [Candidatus Paceibacterota bacterium]|nr:hypothetical protein [Candidatus Paceibacterota bacterium]